MTPDPAIRDRDRCGTEAAWSRGSDRQLPRVNAVTLHPEVDFLDQWPTPQGFDLLKSGDGRHMDTEHTVCN